MSSTTTIAPYSTLIKNLTQNRRIGNADDISMRVVNESRQVLQKEFEVLTRPQLYSNADNSLYSTVVSSSYMLQVSKSMMQKACLKLDAGGSYEVYETDDDSIVFKILKEQKELLSKSRCLSLHDLSILCSNAGFLLQVYAFGIWPYSAGSSDFIASAASKGGASELLQSQRFPPRLCYLQQRCSTSLGDLLYSRVNYPSAGIASRVNKLRSSLLNASLEFVSSICNSGFYTFDLDPNTDIGVVKNKYSDALQLKLFKADPISISDIKNSNKRFRSSQTPAGYKILMLLLLSLQLVLLSERWKWKLNFLGRYFENLSGGFTYIKALHDRQMKVGTHMNNDHEPYSDYSLYSTAFEKLRTKFQNQISGPLTTTDNIIRAVYESDLPLPYDE